MERKTATMDLKGKDYAQVKDRVKEFRKDNPRGDISTKPSIRDDGTILFEATIVKDRSDESSARATGHAYGPNKGDKAFEKVETIAVGRALAYLGYAADGEIASSEEMEQFMEHQEEKKAAAVAEWEKKLRAVKNEAGLRKVWADMPVTAKALLKPVQEEMKAIVMTEAHANA